MTLNYVTAFTAAVLCFIFYAKPDACFINKFFISFNVMLCVVASVVSVLRKVQVGYKRFGLRQTYFSITEALIEEVLKMYKQNLNIASLLK